VVRSDASVVTMYLSEHGNKKMKQVLSRCLKPGARVVTYQFPGTSPSPHPRPALTADLHHRN
jgi:hypothetical protein